jgi:DNA-binding helix-hairpin-helix protein with protein kinase domain
MSACHIYARQIEFAIFQLERVEAAKHASLQRCLQSGKLDDLYTLDARLAAKLVTEMKRFQRYEAQANLKLMRAMRALDEFLAEQDAVEPPEASDLSRSS